ncbi:MAG: pyridoxal phosphate-dependent aminotransferase, partial [bacterium]
MARTLSRRCELVRQSEIRQMSIESDKVEGINMSQGICAIPSPALVRQAAAAAMEAGQNSYTRYDGIAELRSAIARKLKSFNGIAADPATDIIVSSGSTGAFYSACLALLDPGDEVILFEPSYGYHGSTLRAVEAVPAYVRMKAPDWTFAPEDLERAATPRTKGIMVNTPANPSGKVFTREELEWIAAFAVKHDLFVFTDEIYEHITYDGRRHVSPASLPSLAPRTITISGVSKTFSITGWRIGWSVSDAKWARMIGYMSDLVYVCAPAPLQWGVAKALDGLASSHYEGLRDELAVKREKICAALTKGGLTP